MLTEKCYIVAAACVQILDCLRRISGIPCNLSQRFLIFFFLFNVNFLNKNFQNFNVTRQIAICYHNPGRKDLSSVATVFLSLTKEFGSCLKDVCSREAKNKYRIDLQTGKTYFVSQKMKDCQPFTHFLHCSQYYSKDLVLKAEKLGM